MSATIEAKMIEYQNLMKQFVNRQINGIAFRQLFMEMRRQDLDQDQKRAKKWPERYDVKLQEELLDGKIEKQEFNRRWQDLWGYRPTRWLEIFDEVFDELDRFEPDDSAYQRARKDQDVNTRTYYITEDQLRETVNGYLKELSSEGGGEK
jgi:hypothetical protein